ncbi:MAG TPA: response regulator transcription factor [Thermoanaerobaculia bacterium]
MAIRLVLADDHRIILEGLEQLFRRERDFEVVATCVTGDEALEAVRAFEPDILVLDVKMPKMDGLEVLRTLADAHVKTRVVFLTATLEDDAVIEAMELGVWGLVLKESASVALVDSVRKVTRGERALDPILVGRAVDRMSRRAVGMREVQQVLSPREQDVVRMVASGLRNKEIAQKLSITEGTVKFYLHAIYEKLEVHGRVELTLYAQEKGLV